MCAQYMCVRVGEWRGEWGLPIVVCRTATIMIACNTITKQLRMVSIMYFPSSVDLDEQPASKRTLLADQSGESSTPTKRRKFRIQLETAILVLTFFLAL
jgi:hypothetical protein